VRYIVASRTALSILVVNVLRPQFSHHDYRLLGLHDPTLRSPSMILLSLTQQLLFGQMPVRIALALA